MSTADEIAELLVHLGRAARSEDGNAQLTPAQWTALRYLARANTASRTPSAFASFHATTRGTATQTLKALEAKGLIERCAGIKDGRSVCFNLTAAGQSLLCEDPLRDLTQALLSLPPALQSGLCEAVPLLVAALANRRQTPSFGSCQDCRHFDCSDSAAYCACMARVIAATETESLCINFNSEPPKLR